MIIKIDKEAEKLLIEIIDGYTKYAGFKGINNINALMRGIQLIPETPPKPNNELIGPQGNKPEMKKVDTKKDVPNTAK